MLLVPGTGTTMYVGNQSGFYLPEVTTQDFGKQVVVAVPAPLIVQGDYKQVRLLERFQHDLAPLLLCHRIAERSAEALQDAGVQQKLLHRRRLPCEHFFGEVVQHKAMTAAKG